MGYLHAMLALVILAAAPHSVVAARSGQHAAEPSKAAVGPTGLHDFDFLVGEWRVHHRRLKDFQAGAREWLEFDGTCSNRGLMNGWANLEEHALNAPTGAYRALGLRAYDAKTGQWSIWWLDGRYPSGSLDPPVRGRFDRGAGTFYSDYLDKGKPMRVRFLWSQITPTSARWEQALTRDGGKTWETNWIMEFRRVAATEPSAAAGTPLRDPTAPQAGATLVGLHDFGFLVGEWRVRHRYLSASTKEWSETDGTCSNRGLMNGWANVEEHLINAPSGAYRAIGLRAYDAKTGQWSIWWLDGRDPSGALEPPLKGRFDNGAGTFHAESSLGGKPNRMRFIWSQITPTSARWEQAYSSAAGATWETNWTMDFRRVPKP